MELKRRRIGVLMGGWTGERQVSLRSGENVLEALRKKGYHALPLDVPEPDALLPALAQAEVVFNCLHGGVGEDGTLQALLDVLGIPYTGSGMLACALALDKLRAKALFRQAGLAVALHVEGRPTEGEGFEAWCARTVEELGLPLVVKPVREGSSLGVHLVHEAEELPAACREVDAAFLEYFAEKFVPGQEITVGVLRVSGEERPLPPLELRSRRTFYDYRAKYTPGLTEFVLPAELDGETRRRVEGVALGAHRALGCFGYSRVDLRVTPGGEPVVLELNTSPGMTSTSDLPQVAQAAGLDFPDLVEWMLRSACKPPVPPASGR